MNNPVKRTAFAFIDVTISDTNDHTPEMEQEVYVILLPENSPVSMRVLTVSATDLDQV